jgi:hypothetical protein
MKKKADAGLLLPRPAVCCWPVGQSSQRNAGYLHLTLDVLLELAAEGRVHVSWRAAQRFSSKVPVYVAVAIPGEVRFVAPALPARVERGGNFPAALPTELPGFIALPPAARGPLGLAFGQGKSRALVALHQRGAKLDGSFSAQLFSAGTFPIEAGAVALTSCGERMIAAAAGADGGARARTLI